MHYKLLNSPKGVSQEDLLLHVFEAESDVSNAEKNKILKQKRTEFFKVLKALRTGNYNINKYVDRDHNSKRNNKQRESFKYDIIYKNGVYKYNGTDIPIFDELDEEDRVTLPFLMGILESYQSLPVAYSTSEYLKNKFCVSDIDIETSITLAAGIRDFQNEEDVDKVVILQKFALQNRKIQFRYSPVRLNEPEFIAKLFPLQILMYEGLYYLWGVEDLSKQQIVRFRIDRISQIEAHEDPEFNCEEIRKKIKIQEILYYTIGAVPPIAGTKPTTFKIKFYDWAAAYIESAKIHRTMEIDSTSKKKDYRIITMRVYDTYEVSFLLGRFRNYCKVLEPVNYKYDLLNEKGK